MLPVSEVKESLFGMSVSIEILGLKKQTEEDVWSRLTRSGREAGMIIGRS